MRLSVHSGMAEPGKGCFQRLLAVVILIAGILMILPGQVGGAALDTNFRGVVIIGASYAAGWEIAAIEGISVVNKGVGGQESHELLGRFSNDVIALNPQYVIVWGFINDIFRSDPEQVDSRLARTRADIAQMVDMARGEGIQPVLATEILMARPQGLVNALRAWVGALRGKQAYGERVNQHVMQTNAWLRAYAEENKLPLLDFESALSGGDGWRKQHFATEDGSHISPAGYQALNDYVLEKWPEFMSPVP
ncbi:GDSL-type esterase/lipase family protein [Thioalkalivibrio sulfidiphilus]|nr:GDSL-type esterase/lipase family protein [Thioalkalivibrio sulfidiphilus]